MSKFNKGDKVVINRAQIATIHTYDEDLNFLAFELTHGGGSTEVVYGHVSQYDIEHLVTPAVTAPGVEDEPAETAAEDDGPTDEYTTAE